MPAFLTHYACGVVNFNDMKDGAVRESISAHKGAYGMGLAGPDVYFYSMAEAFRPGMTIGRTLHKYRCGAFLQALYRETEQYRGDDRKTAIAYFSGFLGHYALDSSAHPLIFRETEDSCEKRQLGKHFRFEAAIDAYTARYVLCKDIRDTHQMGLFNLSSREKRIIAHMLSEAFAAVYPDASHSLSERRMYGMLYEYRVISSLLMDETGFKEWVFTRLEEKIRGYVYLAPLFINRNLYGMSKEQYDRFRKRFDRGVRFFKKMTIYEEKALRNPEDERARDEFFSQIGNRSYHTGRPMEKYQKLPKL